MCIHKMMAALLALFLLSGCAGMGTASSGETDEGGLSIAALFQTESGDALYGGAAHFSTETKSDSCQLNSDGTVSVSGLPRNGDLLLTLFDWQQNVQGAMKLSFSEGAVIDASTGEDGVGHITVRSDTNEVALVFILTEEGVLQCTLWLANTGPSYTDLPQKGV